MLVTGRKSVAIRGPSLPPPDAYKRAQLAAEARERQPRMTVTLELSDGSHSPSRGPSPQPGHPEPPPASKTLSRTAAGNNHRERQKEEAIAATRSAREAVDRAEAIFNEGDEMAVRETERDEMATAVQRIQDESRRREK